MRWALLAVVALAGCTVPAAPPAPSHAPSAGGLDMAAVTTLLQADHDHADPALHNLSFGMEQVAWLDLLGAEQGPVQGAAWLSDIQFHNDTAYVAVRGGRGGFFIVDTHDPTQPRVLGRYAAENSDSWYLKLNEAGDLAFLTVRARQDTGNRIEPAEPGWNALGQACTGGIQAVDVHDPAHPTLVGCYEAAPRTVNLWDAVIGGQEVLFAVDRGAGQYGVDATDRVLALQVQRVGPVVSFVPLGVVYQGPDRIDPLRPEFVHDITVAEHPLTHHAILEVANWEAGLALVDVSDVRSPRVLGRYDDPSPAFHLNIHTVKAHPGLLDGKQLTVATPEPLGIAESDAPVRFLDTTDPANITQLATWRLPTITPEPYSFSPHDFTLAEGRLYLSYFHAGVWVLDVRDPSHPSPIAFAMPHERSAAVDGKLAHYVPRAETAVLHDGLVWVSDMESGLYAYRVMR